MTQPLRVLVVEDEALIAEELRERLVRLGSTVVGTVDTADRSIELAASNRPDIVLMDIRLKGRRDGVDAAGEIRRRFDIPVVYLTAHSDHATLQRAKETAPYGYLLKPFQERDLLVALEMATHRHTLEQRLRESASTYVATLASIGDGIIAVDRHGRVTFINPVAEALTDFPSREALGLPADAVFRATHDVNGRSATNPLASAMASEDVVRSRPSECFLISRDDAVIPIDSCAGPILDQHGTVCGAVLVFRDIRDAPLSEDSLERGEIETLQSKHMEVVGRLAGGLAHEFNNLLTVVNGCTELATQDPRLPPSALDLLDSVLAAGRQAADLTAKFTALGARQALKPRLLDLNTLVADLLGVIERAVGSENTVAISVPAAPVHVFADPAQIEQVLINLATNARDAMNGGGRVTITTGRTTVDRSIEPGTRPGAYGTLQMDDTGRGVEDAIKPHLFEPFFTTKDVGTGSGLGLAVVYGIVKQSGGFVRMRSHPAQGATFVVYLPEAPNRPR